MAKHLQDLTDILNRGAKDGEFIGLIKSSSLQITNQRNARRLAEWGHSRSTAYPGISSAEALHLILGTAWKANKIDLCAEDEREPSISSINFNI